MKIKNLFSTVLVLITIVAVFSGCSNLFDKDDDDSSSSQKGWLLFSADSSARVANTVNPTGFDFSSDADLTFTLTGTISGGTNQTLGTWSDSAEDGKKAYALMTADTSILVDIGDWTFRLSVTKGGKEVLYGTKTLTVSTGNNPLDFGTLNEASIEDTTRDSEIKVAKGSVNVNLSFPSDAGVKGATASLTDLDSDESGTETSLDITTSGTTSRVVYSATDVDSGTYILAIKLYSDSETKNDTSYLNTYTALVKVAPGCESAGNAELTDINTLCTIDYELSGGWFVGGNPEQTSYNKYAKITLQTLSSRAGYTFEGWSKTSAEATTADYSDGETITILEDTTLYALWTPINYTITYNLNDEQATISDDAVTNFTVETETFSLPTPTTKKNGYTFASWYTTSSLDDGTNLTQIEKGTTNNVILYAKWKSVIAEQIEAMTESGTIKVSGEFSTELITEINKALKNLASNEETSDVLVTIDLSNVTGLTELEEASSDSQNCSFYNCTNLQGIVLPDTLISIEDKAFYGCTSLSSIIIPDGVTSIGNSAFYGCTALSSITIPDSVTSIGKSVFSYCNSLESVTIPNSVTSIGYYAFEYCTSLESITIPDSVTKLGMGAFEYCTSLESITIPDSVTEIGSYAFSGCSAFESITLPDKLRSINTQVFRWCTSLLRIEIPNSVIYISDGAFYGCTALESITIPNSVTGIGSSAFSKCTSLASITIPDSVTTIGNYAFAGCTTLESITIGSGVEKIGFYAFQSCSKLSSATFTDTKTWYYTERNTYSNGTTITPKDMGDSSTAATYLRKTYVTNYWYKE